PADDPPFADNAGPPSACTDAVASCPMRIWLFSSVTGPVYEVAFSNRNTVSPAAGLVPVPLFTALKAARLLNGLTCVPVPAAPVLLTNQILPAMLMVTWALSVPAPFEIVYQNESAPTNPAVGL